MCSRQIHSQSNDKPNIVIIIADDCTHSDLSIYGGQNVKTPAIDQLASEGLKFNKAYVTMAMCTPSRSELYTGLQPVANGASWNHAQTRPGTKSMVQHLAKFGYRTGIAGKLHIQPLKEVFPFELVPGIEENCVSNTAAFDGSGIKEFVTKNNQEPFCLVTALTCPHAPWTVGDPSHFVPENLTLPPYMMDTKETRKSYAKYLAEIEVLDEQVGKTIAVLKDANVYDNTIVIFTSEQGSQFPYCKWTNYDNGVHTAFVVRWKGVTEAGKSTNALIQYNDVLPTLLEAVGGKPEGFDGTSFLKVLKGKKETHRKYAYFMHNNFPEGPPYPIRAITDGKYHYISNLANKNIFIEKHMMGKPEHTGYWSSWLYNITNSENNYKLISGYMIRPQEELFNVEKDRFERNNIAEDNEFDGVKNVLSKELKIWMKKQGDPGASIDSRKEFNAQKDGQHFERIQSDD